MRMPKQQRAPSGELVTRFEVWQSTQYRRGITRWLVAKDVPRIPLFSNLLLYSS